MDKTLLFLFIIKHFGTIKFEAKFLSPSFTLLTNRASGKIRAGNSFD